MAPFEIREAWDAVLMWERGQRKMAPVSQDLLCDRWSFITPPACHGLCHVEKSVQGESE